LIRVVPLASSSAGNAYYITDGTTALLLEAGIKYKEIQRSLNFQTSDIAGCLITHEHGDHGKSASEIMKAGITVYASQGTLEALSLQGHRTKPIQALNQFTIGTWTILPFDIQHDVSEPLGFLLVNQSGDKLLFATDTYYIKYRFQGITHLLVECNYSMKILNENVESGRVPASMKRRLLRSHFSLENVKDFLLANDLSRIQEVWLLHLSDNNSDEALFKREIQSVTGKPVYVAQR
jgi:phosphoribosyl 1,2-cyclic phosphodiesterase